MKQARYLSLTLLVAGMTLPVLAQPHQPTIIGFDAPGAATGAYQGTAPQDINAAGVIIGFYVTPAGGANGFVRAPDGTFTSFAVAGAAITVPESINPKGEIAGYSCFNAFCTSFLRTRGGDLISFEVPGVGGGPGQGALALNINSAGEIAGQYTDGNNVTHGFVRAPGGAITDFDAPGAGTDPYEGTYMATYDFEGLNPEGALVGFYTNNTTGLTHSYVRAPDGSFITFDPPGAGQGPGQGSAAVGINPAGEVSGVYNDDVNGALHGYLRYPGGKFITIDVPGATGTFAQNMNAAGGINGDWYDTNGLSHGFVRTPGGAIIKFDAPDAGTASGQGTIVGGINNRGEVTGVYIDSNNVQHGFLWKR